MISLPSLPSITLPKFGTGAETPKFLKLAAPAGAVLVSFIILFFVVWPTFTKVLNLSISNKQLANRAQSLKTKAEDLASLDRDVLDKQLSESEQLLPSDKGVFSIVSQIEKAASSAGVILNKVDVTPGTVGDSASLGKTAAESGAAPAAGSAPGQGAADLINVNVTTPKVQLSLSLTSDYRGFLQFINILTSLPRVVSVRDLSVSSTGGAGSQGAIRTLLTVDAYWKPLPKELPAVETPIEKLTAGELQLLDKVKSAQAGGTGVPPGNISVPVGKTDIFAGF